jgi:[ribosomal protein S5]-alanine N-acetyltransferase
MEIRTERLILKSLTSDDFGLYSSLVVNSDVMKYITGNALSVSQAEQRFQKALYGFKNVNGTGYFIAKTNDSDEFVGVVKLVKLNQEQAEVGYMLKPEFWGRGFASEMTECMIKLAVEVKIAPELIGIVDPENPASIRVLTRFGFGLYETGQIDGLDAAYYKLKLT